MTHYLQTLAIILLFSCHISCSIESVEDASGDKVQPPQEEKSIAGTVKSIQNGKDGYTAEVLTKSQETYFALVSISNVGGMQNYQRCEVGDVVNFSGKYWTSGDDKQLMVKQIISIESGTNPLLIYASSYQGITPGSKIVAHGQHIQKDEMKTGEGSFEIYKILGDDKAPMGYFLPDPKQDNMVGNIVVDIPAAETLEGIHVGNTFADLQNKLPNIQVHGSEIEGRTYANYNNLSYHLDVPNFTYEVDKTKIPADTKITEIIVNRGLKASSALLSQYQKIEVDEFCWLVNDAAELFAQATRNSKKLGLHYKGESLKVLDSQIIEQNGNKNLWVKVQFTGEVKAGYESNFADGRATAYPQNIGWIDGSGMPQINCK